MRFTFRFNESVKQSPVKTFDSELRWFLYVGLVFPGLNVVYSDSMNLYIKSKY